MERRTIKEPFLSDIDRLIACQGGNTGREEKGLASIGK